MNKADREAATAIVTFFIVAIPLAVALLAYFYHLGPTGYPLPWWAPPYYVAVTIWGIVIAIAVWLGITYVIFGLFDYFEVEE